MHINNKAASLWRLTFSLIFLSIFASCQDPGTVGGDFVEKTEIDIDTLLISNLSMVSLDPYLGRLGRSATGLYNDALFGSIEATSFFKPSIFRVADSVVFDESTIFSMRLQLRESEEYGDTLSHGTYSIYRVNSLWRGSTYKKSSSIDIDQSELIGSFRDIETDTSGFVEFELTGSWKTDYIEAFNMSDSLRNDFYKSNEFGLAIVPDAGNEKIVYANFPLTTLHAFDEDTTSHFILDWGFDFERNGEVTDNDHITLPSTFENVLQVDLEEIADQISNINFVRAELIFTEDTLSQQSSLNQSNVRTSSLGMGVTLGPLDDDKAYEIGFGSIDIGSIETTGQFRFNITNLINSYIFGESTALDDVYLYLAATDGSIAFTSLYSPTAEKSLAPKLVIYGLRGEN